MNTRIAVLDDHELLRDALCYIIAAEPGLEVVGSAGSVVDVEPLLENTDVLLLDLDLPDGGALELASRLRKSGRVRALVVSSYQDHDHVKSALAAGACGYIYKSSSQLHLIEAITQVVEGGTYLDPDIHLDEAERTPAPSPVLSERERAVLIAIARGHSYKHIADELGIGARTVETYRRRISAKLGLKQRAELVRYTIAQGWMNA